LGFPAGEDDAYLWYDAFFRISFASFKALFSFPGRGRPRDEELARLRKEVKSLREANEILKKAAVIFALEPKVRGEPR
jgi:transposase-like protein